MRVCCAEVSGCQRRFREVWSSKQGADGCVWLPQYDLLLVFYGKLRSSWRPYCCSWASTLVIEMRQEACWFLSITKCILRTVFIYRKDPDRIARDWHRAKISAWIMLYGPTSIILLSISTACSRLTPEFISPRVWPHIRGTRKTAPFQYIILMQPLKVKANGFLQHVQRIQD